ncbi:hypothetical protein TNCV_4110351 [Trichonephila clavipes]|nr:hypothetical protein TNCV_4110351 [Trichonephila clavipes]
MDRVATSRTQQTQSVTYHSMSSRTIRRRLQLSGKSARCPLLRVGNHRRLRHQWYDDINSGLERIPILLAASRLWDSSLKTP